MEAMSSPETILRSSEPIRPLKRIEYDKLVAEGCFDDEKVELLFGFVVPMTPIDQAHVRSTYHVHRLLAQQLGERAEVHVQSPLAASDISEPQPDIMVLPVDDNWIDHPQRAFLVVEVARSSLRRDQGPKALLYGLAKVDEYWIVNHVDDVVEVYRDRVDGKWSLTVHRRGETISMVAFPDVTIAVSDILPPP